jgi:hypothetical protein
VIKGIDGFAIEDANGVILAWVNFSDGNWRTNGKRLSEQEAATLATGLSQMPTLIEIVRRMQTHVLGRPAPARKQREVRV